GEGDTEIRVYDIRDLAEDYVRYYYRPNSPAHHAPAPPDSTLRYAAALKDYAQLVTARLGGWADMSELAGRLIINATPEEHARVAAALEQLRVAHAKDPTALLP
ncbi:MAG TPA: hypothetical protein VLJ39_12405, partial [Tepidisphaeraceae bacterium]|nr:hypothetical protein [Tepidisphaeraceae bacterium]